MITLKRILVPTDFSETSDAALVYGRELARMFGASLDLLHVAENVFTRGFAGEGYVAILPELQEDLERSARTRLAEMLIDNDEPKLASTPVLRTSSSPAFEIVAYAKDHDIDLIVMGTEGRGGVAHIFMGSVAERVVRAAPCPVLTVRHPEHEFVLPDMLAVVANAPQAE
jgi:nucleotide-binding universal stress UspA family protein